MIIEVPAISDMDGIFGYIANILKEPGIAGHIYKSIESAIFSLRQFPMRHAVIEDEPFFSNNIRKMPVENYIVFYTVDNISKKIHILRVIHSRRDLQSSFI